MDRLGQTRVLRVAAGVHLVAVAGLVVVAESGTSVWAMAVAAAGGGLALPQVPAAMRSLWGDLTSDPAQRQTAYALVSIVFEVAVMTAPVLVAVLTAVAGPDVAVLVAATLRSAGGFAFAATRGSRAWLRAAGRRGPAGRARCAARPRGARPGVRSHSGHERSSRGLL